MKPNRALFPGLGLAIGLGLVGCTEDTGSALVRFNAYAGGPESASNGKAFEFDTDAGYHVQLDRARLTVGALYLNRTRATLGAQDMACVQPGSYAGEVRAGVLIDALSPELVEFDSPGDGTEDRVLAGEVWLTSGDIYASNDNTRILDVSGTATKGSATFGFHGVVTISANRTLASADPATPGANPLCKQRIVAPIPLDFTLSPGGSLELRVAPELWFNQVDFEQLPDAAGHGERLLIPDTLENPAAVQLFQGLRSVQAYQFHWRD